MIAVFSKDERGFRELDGIPRGLFKRILTPHDLLGTEFIGVVYSYDWERNKSVAEAHKELVRRQPKLFSPGLPRKWGDVY